MTVERVIHIINDAYGYKIVGEKEESALSASRDVIVSELGIGAIFEFLSYDVSEFSDIRKTIHARRFYQLFKKIYSFTMFNMEAFHKIQAGCIFMVTLSGITRGLGDYEYSGFVKDALFKIGKINKNSNRATLNEKLFYIQSAFEKFSRISLGIYSLQIFTKYGMSISHVNRVHEGAATRLLIEIVEAIHLGKTTSKKINKLLSLEIISPEKLEDMIEEYISYAVADISARGMNQGSKKEEKANKKIVEEITKEVHEAFSGLKTDVADLYILNESIQDKKVIFEKEHDQPGISVLFAALLERYAKLYERLWLYESNSFIKRLNMIFIERVKVMFAEQRKQELAVIKNECIRIIEDGLPNVNVYELEGFFNGLDMGKDLLDIRLDIEHSKSKKVINILDNYLSANLQTAENIQKEMKSTLSRIIGPEGIPDEEMKMLSEIVYDFDAVMDLLTEDNQ